MCLINVAHEHFTQTGKKSKPALISFMGPGGRGPRIDILTLILPMLRLE